MAKRSMRVIVGGFVVQYMVVQVWWDERVSCGGMEMVVSWPLSCVEFGTMAIRHACSGQCALDKGMLLR